MKVVQTKGFNLDNLYKHSPCANCPFTINCTKNWLGEERIKEIISYDSFVCHKNNRLQCAGHMLFKKEGNRFIELAGRMNIPLKLSGNDKVFSTEEDCINHHKFNET